jgi:hypothetical protein
LFEKKALMKNYIKILLYTIFFLLTFYSFSQTTIKGTIKDKNNETISFANVILKPQNSTAIIAYCYANENGQYTLKTDKTGDFLLFISSLSHKTFLKNITITSESKELVEDAILEYEAKEINEIIVSADRPITIKKDTITFDAKSFAKGNEQTVEDLLKKIPGLTVSDDGTIKVGNQEIEKVMIDGDDLFEKGYKILTKNMPANPIDKVELYQKYSNNKHLKGIEESEKVALNLTLKDDFKRQWFGNMQLGYGVVSKNRYEVRSNLMNFGKKNKYYFLTNLNNIGLDAVGDINHLIRPFRYNEPASIGDNQSAFSVLSLGGPSPNFKEKRVNFNNAEMLSLNSIFTISSKIKLKALGFFSSDEINFYRNSFNSFSVGATNFENKENYLGKNAKKSGFGKLDFTYDVSKTKTFEITSKYNNSDENNKSTILFNDDLLAERLHSNNQLIDQKAVYTNKFKEKKVFILSARYINEKTPQNYAVNQFIYQDLFSDNANNLIQNSQNKMQFAGFEAHILDRKKNGNLLELKAGNQYRNDALTTSFQLKNNETIVNEPSNYQNLTQYQTNDLYVNGKYIFKYKKISYNSELEVHQLYNGLHNSNSKTSQTPFFINPKMGLEWEINKKNKINTAYSYNTSNATILEVYNNYIQTGFRSFTKGTGEFNQLEASNLMLNYTLGNWGDKFFANTFVMYVKNHDFFSTNSILDQNYSQTDKIIIKDREFLSFSSNIDKYFRAISSNLKFTFGGSKSNYKNIVNNSDFREIKSNSVNYGLELRSGFRGIFNYHLGSKWNYNEIITTISNSFTNNMSFLDLSFIMNDKINFQMQTERYYFGNLEKQNNTYYFLDLEARYVVKENKLTFTLSGNNLFDNKTFKNYSISDINVSKTEYRLQPRYVLLKMEFRF